MQYRIPRLALVAAALLGASAFGADTSEFFRAIRANDLATLRTLAKDPTTVNSTDARKTTPLIYAALFGNPESVRILLNAGADVDARNDTGLSALIVAACNPEMARMLVDKGAGVNAKTNQGRTPLIVAASCTGSFPTLKLLLAKGADVKAADGMGNTALLAAASYSGYDNVKLLIDAGSDVDAKDISGQTALMSAAGLSDVATTRLLLAKGADPNVANTFGGRVRHGDINLKQLTALHFAAPHAPAELVRALLDAGAKAGAKDVRDMTPLMIAAAAEKQDAEVVKLLVKATENVNAADIYGETAMDWARKFNHPAVLNVLAGANIPSKMPAPPPPSRTLAPNGPRAAMEQGMGLVGKASGDFFKEGGCVACHHQAMAIRAWAAMHKAGVTADETPAKQYAMGLMAARPMLEPNALQMVGPPGDTDSILYVMTAAADAKAPASPLTDATVNFIANRQLADGRWSIGFGGISRAPLEESDVTRTMMAVKLLKAYAWPARQAEFDQRIARARQWLESIRPATSYEQAERLLAMSWAGSDKARLQAVAKDLLASQRADGGWAQTDFLDSDAYATGLALHALNETGQARPPEAAYRKGVEYLLRTQLDDGSWYVRSRSPKFQPYFQSGFPHDHDQWISMAATAMAAAALAPAASVLLSQRVQ